MANKLTSKPAVKSPKPKALPKTSPGTLTNPGYDEYERKYKIKDSVDTLVRAEEIRRDKGLMRDVKKHVAKMGKICK